jgi:hypothetical protein
LSQTDDIKNDTLPIYSSAEAGAVTMASSESDIYMVISWRHHAAVKVHWLNRLRFQQWLRIGLYGGIKPGYSPVGRRVHRA